MRNICRVLRLCMLVVALTAVVASEAKGRGAEKRIVGYVTSWSKTLPDAKALTNINYAFGHVTDSFDGVRIDNPSRLKEVVALKKKNCRLAVQLSVGGWGSGGFSEMAADADKRKAFAADCRRIVDEYGLDGIDIDWEYPGSGAAGISYSKDDKDNYVLLMKELRKALGKGKLLTLASPATMGFYEFKPVMPYVDFVNVMAYDLNRPPYHHSSLFRSPLSGDMTADEGVRAHIDGGVPPSKIVLGVPFYGHGKRGVFDDFVNYRNISPEEGMKEVYDEKACVPYLVDGNGDMVLTYDNPRSLERKCRYVNDMGLGGIMFWEVDGDTPDGSLLQTLRRSLHH